MIKNSEVTVASDVNSDAVISFMEKCRENKTDVHSFEIIHGGEVKVKIAAAPYSFGYKQQLYSMSKSFSSTAIGLLVDGGVIDIEDRVVDIFPDKCPNVIGENLSKMRLRHLLSMNTGHSRCLLNDIRRDKDPVKSFLSFEPDFEPGTHFFYNNAATFMLSEIVRKYTGMTMYDFLSQRLFAPLEIVGTHWNAFADGNSQGAVGQQRNRHSRLDSRLRISVLAQCPFGYVQNVPSYSKGGDYIGRSSYFKPGCFENGSVYNHGVAFKIVADCRLGKADVAYDTVKMILPENPHNSHIFNPQWEHTPCSDNYYTDNCEFNQ